MSGAKKDYECQFCHKACKGYQSWRRHESGCAMNPANQQPAPAVAEEEEPAQELEEVKETEAETPVVDDPFMALKMEVDARLNAFEHAVANQLGEVIKNLEAQMASYPQMIDEAVAKFVTNTIQGNQAPAVPPTPAPSHQGAEVVAGPTASGAQGVLANLFKQVDPVQVAAEFIKLKGDGNINKAVARFLSGSKSPPLDAKYATRGMGHALSMIRSKKADPHAQAIAVKAMANEMIKDKALPGSLRGYYRSMIAGADAFLMGEELIPAPPPIETPPPVTPDTTPPGGQ